MFLRTFRFFEPVSGLLITESHEEAGAVQAFRSRIKENMDPDEEGDVKFIFSAIPADAGDRCAGKAQ